ncbi:PEPxxWA-CTERM sorting domain-containing protein [Sphingomonas sp. KR1UV-12]|uniref:PEPxxWA-CTERM sorting domain-containing protein n=1 Tax=Sphingomonas aurea TaxID=3063994 RepID=A0ABT9EKL0_9SPHN|nr:PEPxxWA-CTERM sorting domain-containing protein [Sphingomonas sp. KR1UV-12]MDP1027471.1 PEPxxWA-CTERM sorting domain-containing protein [Sphingomonas sp. KR1UV-12]
MKAMVSAVALAAAFVAAPAAAAPVLTEVNTNLLNTPYTFTVQGVSFTLSAVSSFSAPLLVSNGTNGAFSSVFGSPSSSFVNRNTVQYGPGIFGSYASFPTPTSVNFSNGDNFLGIRATVGTDNYYGFVYTTNNILKGYGFETMANTAITATTAVPEPATWAMMLVGFGMVAGVARYRRRAMQARYA